MLTVAIGDVNCQETKLWFGGEPSSFYTGLIVSSEAFHVKLFNFQFFFFHRLLVLFSDQRLILGLLKGECFQSHLSAALGNC